MSKSRSRIPSPARSLPMTPRRRDTSRKARSVCSPARSTASGRLSCIIGEHKEQNIGSMSLSPLTRKSVLTDNTDIEEIGRKSWWRDLGENSRDVMEVLKENNAESHNILENIEIQSQEEKRYTLDLPDSSDSESIQSIVIPQRKLFREKENQSKKNFNQFGTRATLDKLHKDNAGDKTVTITTKELFRTESKSRPVFPSALLDMSSNTSTSEKTMAVVMEKNTRGRNLFSNQNKNVKTSKHAKMFAQFIESDSEDELPEIQPKFFALQSKPDTQRPSMRRSSSRGVDTSMASSMDIDDWQLLPSSTMVDHEVNISATIGHAPKKVKLSKLSEVETDTTSSNDSKRKHSKKSISPKNNENSARNMPRSRSKILNDTGERMNKSQNKSHSKSNLSQSSRQTKHKDKSGTEKINKSQNKSQSRLNISPSSKATGSATDANKSHNSSIINLRNANNNKSKNTTIYSMVKNYNDNEKVMNESIPKSSVTQNLNLETDKELNDLQLLNDNDDLDFSLTYEDENSVGIKEATINKTSNTNKDVNASKNTLNVGLKKNSTIHVSATDKNAQKTENKIVEKSSETIENKSQMTQNLNDEVIVDENTKNKIRVLDYEREKMKIDVVNNVSEDQGKETERLSNQAIYEGQQKENTIEHNEDNQNRSPTEHTKQQEMQNKSQEELNRNLDENTIGKEHSQEKQNRVQNNTEELNSENETRNNASQKKLDDEENESQKQVEDDKNKSTSENGNKKQIENFGNKSQEQINNTKNESQEHSADQNENQGRIDGNKIKSQEEIADVEHESQKEVKDSENESHHKDDENQDLEQTEEDEHKRHEIEDIEYESQDQIEDGGNTSQEEIEGDKSKSKKEIEDQNERRNKMEDVENNSREQTEDEKEENESQEQLRDDNDSHSNLKDAENENKEEMSQIKSGVNRETQYDEEINVQDETQENGSDQSHNQENDSDQTELEENVDDQADIEENDSDQAEIEENNTDQADIEENDRDHADIEENDSDQADIEENDSDQADIEENDSDQADIEENNSDQADIEENDSDQANIEENYSDQADIEVNDSDKVNCMESKDANELTGSIMESERNDNQVNSDDEEQIKNTRTPNVSHDTTGRNRHKSGTPEAVLYKTRIEGETTTFRNRNTSIRKTKIMIQNQTLELFDGSKNSSDEGSGWDSHRTTRKTLRQTFGKDFSIRKSLRAMVMEKSAKAHVTVANDASIAVPQANSTEFPEPEMTMNDIEMHEATASPEVSIRTRQAAIVECLERAKRQRIDENTKADEEVKKLLAQSRVRIEDPFKIPTRPMFRRPVTQPKPKAKDKKSPLQCLVPLENLPEEFVKDLKYKPPKRFAPRNAAWLTKRLYKYLENKLEPKYDYKARVRAERLAQHLYEFVQGVRRRGAPAVAPAHAVDALKHEMARLNIVKTHYDFYNFFHEFMPREVRIKVIPDIVNKIPHPRTGVFSDIL